MPAPALRIALAGNPNSGKTTVFNRYTGSRQHVGNYPGVTVEKKEGLTMLDGREVSLLDLPGAYSLSAFSPEELVARRVLAEEKPGAVIDVVDACVLERNLYLTVLLLEMGRPVIIALNMMDEARAKGLHIDADRLREMTGVRAIPTVGRTGEGLPEVLREAVRLADESGGEVKPLEISYGPDIDEVLLKMVPLVEKAGLLVEHYQARWVALKFLERDTEVLERAQKIDPNAYSALRELADAAATHIRETLNMSAEAVITDYRYGWINYVMREGKVKSQDESVRRIAMTDKIDQVLTNRFFGPLCMLGVLYLMYFFTIEIGDYPLSWVEAGFSALDKFVGGLLPDGRVKSLICDGIIAGVGGVMGFVPLIMIMFMLIAILEDSGYMARIAYMMDRIFRFFGLHGASIMPFIISGGIAGGCAVPGVMATRTLRSSRERLATMLTVPYMACGAKIPVFLLFVGIFFEKNKTMIMFLLTLAGWVMALLVARLLRSTLIRGEATPFVMELPPYRLPTLSGVLIHAWERAWQYMKKAGTIILAISVIIWALMTYPGLPEDIGATFETERAALTEKLSEAPGDDKKEIEEKLADIDNQEASQTLRHSYAGRLGLALESLTAPAGFDWRTNIALIGGIAAKEVVVSTLGTAYSLGSVEAEEADNLAESIRQDPSWTTANCVALLLFTLLYSPCFVTLAIIKQESGSLGWLFFSLFFNLSLAYGVAVAANQIILRL